MPRTTTAGSRKRRRGTRSSLRQGECVHPSRGGYDKGRSLPQVGVRELRQNLSVYPGRIEAGETLEVPDRGQPVARLTPLPAERMSALDRLVAKGGAVRARGGSLADLGPPPDTGPGPRLSDVLAAMRDEDDR